MRGKGNAVPPGNTSQRDMIPLCAEAHSLIDRLPLNILIAILPVLKKYAAEKTPEIQMSGTREKATVSRCKNL